MGALALPAFLPLPAAEAWLPREALEILCVTATNHPSVLAARDELAALGEDRRSLDGFYSPALSLAGGLSSGPVESETAGLASPVSASEAALDGSARIPVRSGAYIGLGASHRKLDSSGMAPSYWQTSAGMRLEAPLLRNRGFAAQRALERQGDARMAMGLGNWGNTLALAQRDALAAFAYELYSGAVLEQYEKALRRVEILLEESRERVGLKTMAEYQLYPTEMEVRFKLDDVRKCAAAYTNAHKALELAAGGVRTPYAESPLLLRWAKMCVGADLDSVASSLARRHPAIEAAEAEVAQLEAKRDELGDSAKSSLGFSAFAGVKSDSRARDADGALRTDDASYEAALVWSRPFSFEGEEASLRASAHRLAASRRRLVRLRSEIETEKELCKALFLAASERFGASYEAVEYASKALMAETERLSLGEGGSRNVLDAQSDLTDAEGRSNQAAYDVIVSFLDYLVAAGVPLESGAAKE